MNKSVVKKPGQTGLAGQDVRRYGGHNLPTSKITEIKRRPDNKIEEEKSERIERILTRERDSHFRIYGRNFELVNFKETLCKYSLETIDYWESKGWDFIFFPRINISEQGFFHDLKVVGQEEQSFRAQVVAGRVFTRISFNGSEIDKDALFLKGNTILAERYPYDFSRKVFQKIRHNQKLSINADIRDSHDIWEEEMRPSLAEGLKVEPSMVRLKRVVEMFILHLYQKRLNRQKEEQEKWEWCQECFDTPFTQLRGNFFQLDYSWYYKDRTDALFRPIVEL